MNTDIYAYKDYKKYLRDMLKARSQIQRGPQARLAEFIRCHLAYLSQVLKGTAHLSPEQAEACNRFFKHNKPEGHYFLNLVNYARAGTHQLKQYYLEMLTESSTEQARIANKLQLKKTIAAEVQATYYSSWEYLAIHIATSIQAFQTKQALVESLGLDQERVIEVLDFLVSHGLVKKDKERYEMTENGFHLGSDSPFLKNHHINWRMFSIRALDYFSTNDVHYSSVISCNSDDVPKIKEIIVRAIAEIRKIVRDSTNENSLMSYSLDLFPVIKEKKE